MENTEGILDAIKNFESGEDSTANSNILDEFLKSVAKTGDPQLAWSSIRSFIRHKLSGAMTEFYEFYGGEDEVETANIPSFAYLPAKNRILQHFDSYVGAPFTIQRLCEILVDPMRHYKRTDKFLRGLEKNILVVSHIEPGCSKRKPESPRPFLVNGIQAESIFSHSMNSNNKCSISVTIVPDSEETSGGDTDVNGLAGHSPKAKPSSPHSDDESPDVDRPKAKRRRLEDPFLPGKSKQTKSNEDVKGSKLLKSDSIDIKENTSESDNELELEREDQEPKNDSDHTDPKAAVMNDDKSEEDAAIVQTDTLDSQTVKDNLQELKICSVSSSNNENMDASEPSDDVETDTDHLNHPTTCKEDNSGIAAEECIPTESDSECKSSTSNEAELDETKKESPHLQKETAQPLLMEVNSATTSEGTIAEESCTSMDSSISSTETESSHTSQLSTVDESEDDRNSSLNVGTTSGEDTTFAKGDNVAFETSTSEAKDIITSSDSDKCESHSPAEPTAHPALSQATIQETALPTISDDKNDSQLSTLASQSVTDDTSSSLSSGPSTDKIDTTASPVCSEKTSTHNSSDVLSSDIKTNISTSETPANGSEVSTTDDIPIGTLSSSKEEDMDDSCCSSES